MKKLCLLWLALVTVNFTGCAPLDPRVADGRPRFHEAAVTDFVAIYYTEQSIFITKPDTREGGFLPLLSKADVAEFLTRPEIGRGLGVVIVGQMATEQAESVLLDEWQAQLMMRGFRRVVCLRAGGNDSQLNGLPILRDSGLAARNDAVVTVAAGLAGQ
ncbi:MAG: hypothetical protein RL380_1185 [Verrucomicrobiota bacterium]|jgi:hypothetical protein